MHIDFYHFKDASDQNSSLTFWTTVYMYMCIH